MNCIELSYLRMGSNVGFCVKDVEPFLIPELHDWSNEQYRLHYITHSTKTQHPVTLKLFIDMSELTFQTTNWRTCIASALALETTQLWRKWDWIMRLQMLSLAPSSRSVDWSEGYLTTLIHTRMKWAGGLSDKMILACLIEVTQFLSWSVPVWHTGLSADHSGRAVWGMNCLRPLEHWDRGFESHSRHGCLCAFILCSCCPLCR
jgi:hypothetical protein